MNAKKNDIITYKLKYLISYENSEMKNSKFQIDQRLSAKKKNVVKIYL